MKKTGNDIIIAARSAVACYYLGGSINHIVMPMCITTPRQDCSVSFGVFAFDQNSDENDVTHSVVIQFARNIEYHQVKDFLI